MNREFLKGLGLDDANMDKVMAEHGKTIESHKTKVSGLEENLKDVQGQLTQRDKDLTDLKGKAKGSEELQQQLTDLQGKYDTDKAGLEEKIKKQTFDYALERALSDAKAKNPKAVKALLNTEAIKLDGEKLLGLEEQLKTLTESDGYLFAEKDADTPPIVKGAKPAEGNKGTTPPESVGAGFAVQANKQTEPVKNTIWD